MQATLLIELLSEELPPKSLSTLSLNFADSIRESLVSQGLLAPTVANYRRYATPRRLAVLLPKVLTATSDRQSEVFGPSVTAAPQAVAGFAKRHGVEVKALEQRETAKGKVFFAKVTRKGATLDAVLANIVDEAVKKLPIPKMMR